MSQHQPYSPMASRKLATEEQIQAMLERMKAGPRQVIAKPPEPVKVIEPGIEWDAPVKNPDGTGYCKSKCAGWCICKVREAGVVKYAAWRTRNEWRFCVGVRDTFEAAKGLCQ